MANKRRNPPAQWPLPDVVDPVERLCVKVYVPNDPAHIAAFRGALLALQSAYHWADDPTHKAKDVALVWREILRSMGTDNWGCGIDTIEFRQVGNCEIQYRIDGGSWTHIATLYDCARGAILDAIADGTIAAPSQQPAGGTIPVLECHTYNITLKANQPWHSPNPVSAGYSIQVANARGGWSDVNTVIGQWACPNGTGYAFGQCGTPLALRPADPLPSVSHLRLIGYCNSVYMDMYNTTYIVPNGTPQSDFFLQANDDQLADNAGEIQLDVTICNYSQWCYTFDFRAASGGWVATKDSNNEGGANWVDGQGWQSVWNVGRHTQHINLKRDFDDSYLTRIEAEYDLIIDSATYKYHAVSIALNGVQQYGAAIPAANGNNLYDHTFSPQIGADNIVFEMRQYADSTDWSYLRSVTLHGTGVNPFGTSNCI